MSFHGIPIPFTDEQDWLDKRKQGIGASDVAAIFRLSKWQSPYSLWADKTGQLPDEEPSDAMLVGQVVQPAIINLWEQRTGLWGLKQGAMWQHPEIPWALATPDALIFESPFQAGDSLGDYDPALALAVLEVKHEFETWDETPTQYVLQVIWQMGVTGLIESPGQIVNLTARKKLQIFDVEWDPDLWANLLQGASNFWELVVGQTPPPVDDSDATADALSSLFPADGAGGEVEIDALADKVEQLRGWKARLSIAKQACKQFENDLKAAMGDADVGLINGEPAVTWKSQTKKAHMVAESTFRVLRIKEPKK